VEVIMSDFMGNDAIEKRWAKRMTINASIKLQTINNDRAVTYEPNRDVFEVEVTNISKGGIGLETREFLPLNSYYEAKIVLWTKETFDATIEVVRMESKDDTGMISYGCKFVGLGPADQFKIDVYQIVSETN
jgi:c-di-GMP-binding flagellar brake protein YcgR